MRKKLLGGTIYSEITRLEKETTLLYNTFISNQKLIDKFQHGYNDRDKKKLYQKNAEIYREYESKNKELKKMKENIEKYKEDNFIECKMKAFDKYRVLARKQLDILRSFKKDGMLLKKYSMLVQIKKNLDNINKLNLGTLNIQPSVMRHITKMKTDITEQIQYLQQNIDENLKIKKEQERQRERQRLEKEREKREEREERGKEAKLIKMIERVKRDFSAKRKRYLF